MKFKFIDVVETVTLYLSSDDGNEYRTDSTGSYWERLYGNSWEPILNSSDEDACRLALEQFNMEKQK